MHSKESLECMQHEHDGTKAQLKAKEEKLVCAPNFRVNMGFRFVSRLFLFIYFVLFT